MTDKETAFLEHYIECADATEAAIKAGYSAKTAHVAGSKLKRKLEAEIRERVGKNFGSFSAEAAKIIRDLAHRSTNEQTRYHAAKDILDRAGFKPTDKYEEIDHEPSDPAELIRQVAASLTANPQLLIDILRQEPKAYQAVSQALRQLEDELKTLPATEKPAQDVLH
jgi:hypothetical protein